MQSQLCFRKRLWDRSGMAGPRVEGDMSEPV